jgi:hypothetical protein
VPAAHWAQTELPAAANVPAWQGAQAVRPPFAL